MIDTDSATWRDVREWAERQLKASREANDDIRKTPEETAGLRGEIRMLKRVMNLPVELRPIQGEAPFNLFTDEEA